MTAQTSPERETRGSYLPKKQDARFVDTSAEGGIIGAIFYQGFEKVEGLGISPFDFDEPNRHRVFLAAEDMHASGQGCTWVSLAKRLGMSSEDLRLLGSEEGTFATQPLLADWAGQLRECYVRRHANKIGLSLADGSISPSAARAELENLVSATIGAPVDSLFADIEAILAAGTEPERPTVAEIAGNGHMLYAGRLNEIHGEPSAGKTNITLALSVPILAAGGTVLFLDPEDCAQSAVRRLLTFGCDPAYIVRGFKHVASPTPVDLQRLAVWADKRKPDLVVVDGLAETLASMGLDEDDPTDFLGFCHSRLTPFTKSGAAVLLSDHVTKSTEGRGRWSRGTGAKLGRYDGAVYSVELGKAYSPTVPGFVRLKVAKDRNGGVGTFGQCVAEIHFTPDGEGKTAIEFRKPVEHGRFIPTAIMEKISRRLEAFPESTKQDLRKCGKAEYVDAAIHELITRGFLSVERVGSRSKFELKREFREEDLTDE